jgi:hypothetical protein
MMPDRPMMEKLRMHASRCGLFRRRRQPCCGNRPFTISHEWAGKFRMKRAANGVPPHPTCCLSVRLSPLCDDQAQ